MSQTIQTTAKIAKKQSVKCPSCGGDGLYKRHTSYTVHGKPICFRCNGTGNILSAKELLSEWRYTPVANVSLVDYRDEPTGEIIIVHWKRRNDRFTTKYSIRSA